MEERLKSQQLDGVIHLGENESIAYSEVDKRLMMYRNMRMKLLQELE